MDVHSSNLTVCSTMLRVAVVVDRMVERETESRTGRIGVKIRDLAPKYCAPDKVSECATKLREKGLWQWDEDWPNDEEDRDIPCMLNMLSKVNSLGDIV